MQESLHSRGGMQPSCSYDAASIEQRQQPQCCWDTRQHSLRCPRVQKQTLHRRQGRKSRSWCPPTMLILVLAATLIQPSPAFVLSGDAQDRAFEDMSMLARAGKLLTVAVSDAANAIGATDRRSGAPEKRPLIIPDKKVRPLQTHGTNSQRPCRSFSQLCHAMPIPHAWSFQPFTSRHHTRIVHPLAGASGVARALVSSVLVSKTGGEEGARAWGHSKLVQRGGRRERASGHRA